MSPPSYLDLSESAHELLNKGFNYGLFKLDWKSKADSLKFVTSCISNHDTKSFWGNFGLKYKLKEHGIKFMNDCNTDGQNKCSLIIKDQILDGLKLSFETLLLPNIGKKSASLGAAYKTKQVHLNFDVDFDFAGPNISASGVLCHKGWLLGALIKSDPISNPSVVYNNFAFGYKNDDISVISSVTDGTEFEGSIYQKVNKNLKMAVIANWSSISNETKFVVGGKYSKDNGTFRAKVTNLQQVALSYQLEIWKDVTLTMSTLLEGDKKSVSDHKFGVGLNVKV